MIKQRTLKNSVHVAGIGVHSGGPVSLTLQPAPSDTGIVFRRTDLDPVVEIPARIACIGNTDMCTCLVKDAVVIATVEHLLSALSALQIDNLYVDLSYPELPILDGSSKPFIELMLSAGIEEQAALKKFIRIKKTVEIMQNDKWARFEPHDGFRVAFEIAFDHPVILQSEQRVTFDFSQENYIDCVSSARTFGFLADYEMMLAKKLAMGSSLDNTVVLDTDRVVNPDGLRYPDEFVKHKILDAIGDLYLVGHNIIGAFSGYKSGHAVNSALLKKLLSDESAWEMVTFECAEDAPLCYSN